MSSEKVEFLYLSEEDMIKAGVEDMAACIDTMEEMFKLLKVGRYRMGGKSGNSHGCMISFPTESPFPEMPLDGPDRRFIAMPAYLGGEFDLAGVKWYGSNTNNRAKGLPRSILMLTLNDKDTGAPIAYMSANVLSAVRTGAVPGIGFKRLSRKDAKIATIVGPGVMSRTSLAAILTVRPSITTVKVKGRGKASLNKFIDDAKSKYPNVKFIACDTMEEAVKDSDIVSCNTSSPAGDPNLYPYIKEDWIKPGALVTSTAALRFDDDFVINRARIVTDNIKLYQSWEEEYAPDAYNVISIPAVRVEDLVAQGKMSEDRIDDLADILTGKIPERNNDDEIILYSIGGMPVEDVAWGKKVYERAKAEGIGTMLKVWDKPELA